nr:signal peptidase I [uncultured Blautia sp.]
MEEVKGFLIKLLLFLVIMFTLFGVIFGLAQAPNDDMFPRISAGDLMLYYRLPSAWHNEDVLVYIKEGQLYVGRIVARSGDTVEITDQGALKVNGSTVQENRIYFKTLPYDSEVSYPLTVGTDQFFALSDMREGGKDSRWFGCISKEEVKGKVISILRRNDL